MSSYTIVHVLVFCAYENSLSLYTMEYVLIFCIYALSVQASPLFNLRLNFQFSISFLHTRKLNSLKRVALHEFNFRISIWFAVKSSLCFLIFFCRVCIDPEWAILGGILWLKEQTKHVQYGLDILVSWFYLFIVKRT